MTDELFIFVKSELTRPQNSRMMSLEVIMPLKLQSNKMLIYDIWDR